MITRLASADLVDLKLLQAVAKTYKPVILSVGMANLGEIEQALQIFNEYAPEDIVLLHCVSNYPCADKSLNLNVMKTLEAAFPHPVGYSDHSVGNLAAVISIVLGAKVIEKHFTLDKSLSGPDHAASTTPAEFRDLVEAIRRAEIMLGSGKKTCQVEEEQMSLVSRKSITLAKDMCKGEVISENDLVMMRPGTGLRANSIQDIVGKCLRKDMGAYSLLDWTDIDECS